ncbi:Metallo-dependent phosphatase [Sodiomyces alkalinus F11]|uniref:Metallo-dependent phosphatase n=1 Tax=Sodiomyces alkalinus (strain CBS 110278 / VKM F-3762 / F11) TaxID=1314773 RepID=A0A3N2Q708_SODAK|nr:Metallo-dependent phosphatase [Sodiomyces alkalinus F11]ROT42573.1 Metallo-dependent phosphatase [Sodiomyces alkalinus F11]
MTGSQFRNISPRGDPSSEEDEGVKTVEYFYMDASASLLQRRPNSPSPEFQLRVRKQSKSQRPASANGLTSKMVTKVTKLITLMANLSICSAACLSSEIHRIQSPRHQLFYSPPYAPPSIHNAPRLLVIGDVHGMRHELEELLEKAEYSPTRGDRVILAGDLINKGPDSTGVLELAMQINATAVRGNHEDRVLRAWAGAEVARTLAEANGEDGDAAVSDYESRLNANELEALRTAWTLTPEQRAWSAALPLTLRLGDLPGLGEAAVVHAGMAPGVAVEEQDPWAMYTVRSVLRMDENGGFVSDKEGAAFEQALRTKLRDMRPGTEPSDERIAAEREKALEIHAGRTGGSFVPTDTNDGQWWVEVWNEVQKAKPEGETLTLFYGHDSRRGINIWDYSFGLDSRCVDGGKLTALVLEPDESSVCGSSLNPANQQNQ